jgi:hypothetical protein
MKLKKQMDSMVKALKVGKSSEKQTILEIP